MRLTILNLATRLALSLLVLSVASSMARATPPNTLFGSVAVCDPNSPQSCAAPNSAGELPVANNAYPTGATAVNASSGNVAAASAVAALPAVTAKTNYVTGIQLSGGGATAGACVTVTLAGLIGGTASHTFCSPTGATVAAQPLSVQFYPPVPASAVNTPITLTMPSLGAGNTNATANIQGFVK